MCTCRALLPLTNMRRTPGFFFFSFADHHPFVTPSPRVAPHRIALTLACIRPRLLHRPSSCVAFVASPSPYHLCRITSVMSPCCIAPSLHATMVRRPSSCVAMLHRPSSHVAMSHCPSSCIAMSHRPCPCRVAQAACLLTGLGSAAEVEVEVGGVEVQVQAVE
jgi:hypothetical protein